MSFFETRLTKLFGIEYPIIQGGMAAGLVSTAELTAAVANAAKKEGDAAVAQAKNQHDTWKGAVVR